MNRTLIATFSLASLLVSAAWAASPGSPRTGEEQKVWETKYDKLNIRHAGKMLTDTSPEFLTVPSAYDTLRDFDVAKTPPTVDFAIVQGLSPEYLPYDIARKTGGAWGGWGDMTRGPDGCFYFSISNHLSNGPVDSYIIKYDPKTKRHMPVVSLRSLIGWNCDEFGDGKIHGDPDVGPDGDMWFLSYFGPIPTDEEWDTVYKGSYVVRHNVFTGRTEHFGIPLEGDSWPYHNYDWQRGVLFGIGHLGDVIVYDTKAKKMIFGGRPPDGIQWYERCTMLDRDTGVFYTTDSGSPLYEKFGKKPEPVSEHRFVSYVRRNNTFTRMNATVPNNPVTGKSGPCRAHSEKKDASGAFWCFDFQGTLFKFFPAEDRTELVGVNWGKSGSYTANLCMSPKGRYLYYIPGLAWGLPAGTPVVQYDTKTGRKKVLGFVFDHYLEKYGYSTVRCYGVELNATGESLAFYANGGFTGPEDQSPMEIKMRRAAVFQFHIPASERME